MKNARTHRARRRALGPLAPARPAPAAGDLRPALHELGVQQVELLARNQQLEEACARLRRSVAYYSNLFANAPIAYVMIDRYGVIEDLNLTATSLFARTRDQLIGKPFLCVVARDSHGAFLNHMRRCRADGFAKTDLEISSGESVRLAEVDSLIGTSDADDRPRFGTVVLDLRDRRAAEEDRAAAERERRRAEQREAVLRASSDQKDRFVAELSHELRTPLTPILAVVSSLRERADLPGALRSVIEMIQRNVEIEARLIDDLLDVSRIERSAPSLQLQTLDLHDVLREVASDLGSQVQARRIDFRLDLNAPHSRVAADPLRLRQIFWNLVSNAIHNTPAGEHIVMSSSNIGEEVRVVVRDTGIGIEPSELVRIFEPFARAEPAKRRQDGLGLGLAIVKGLVEAHGGQVFAFSEGSGRGSRFVVELPTTSAPVEEQSQTSLIAPPAVEQAKPVVGEPKPVVAPIAETRRRILLVEDHADTREALQVSLELKGYDVRLAKDVASGLEQAREPVDVVVCDIGLPDGSGFDLMRRISAERPVKAIAVTGYGSEHDIELAKQSGFAAHLTKPIAVDKLLEAIETLCRQGAGGDAADTRPEAP